MHSISFQDIIPSYETNNLSKEDSNEFVKFLGLESSEPIAQIGGTGKEGEAIASSFFSGHYENTVGTSTFFTLEDNNPEEGINNTGLAYCRIRPYSDSSLVNIDNFLLCLPILESKTDQVFSDGSEPQSKRIRYICKTDKKLVLKRVFLNKKANSEVTTTDADVIESRESETQSQATKFRPCPAGPSAAPSDLHNK